MCIISDQENIVHAEVLLAYCLLDNYLRCVCVCVWVGGWVGGCVTLHMTYIAYTQTPFESLDTEYKLLVCMSVRDWKGGFTRTEVKDCKNFKKFCCKGTVWSRCM